MAASIGVSPPEAFHSRERLFNALELAYQVRFEPRASGEWRELNGMITFGDHADAACPHLAIVDGNSVDVSPGGVTFADSPFVDERLRNQTLVEASAAPRRLQPRSGDHVLARSSGDPVWLRRGPSRISATPLDELDPGQTLRDQFTAGRFLGLLPLVDFLREVTGERAWQTPPLRAALIFDDPNLHADSYGFLHFPSVIAHARRHGYHIVLASIPLDFAYAQSSVVRLIADNADRISLTIHGNNHESTELQHAASREQALAVAAEALRRTHKFEQRTGLRVARVMCPPHEVCSRAMRFALFELGYDAMASAHPEPHPLADWQPAQFVAGGFGSLPRHSLGRSLDDIVLRAYLGQPLLLFGHHTDAAAGLDRLAEIATRVNPLGSVQWGGLEGIVRSNFATRHEGGTLRLRLYTRQARVPVPASVAQIKVELPVAASADGDVLLVIGGEARRVTPDGSRVTTTIVEGPFPTEVEVRVLAVNPVGAEAVPRGALRLWPILRRGLTEGRDRMAPLRARRTLVRTPR